MHLQQIQSSQKDIVARIEDGYDPDEIKHYMENEHAEGLYHNNELVG